MVAPIFKRLINNDKDEIFHSSTFARAQNGEAIGAASSTSYSIRQQINSNRQNIGAYKDSIVANQRNTTSKAATYENPGTLIRSAVPGMDNSASTPVGAASSRAAFNASASQFSRVQPQKPAPKP